MSERKQTSGEFVNPLNTRHSSLSAQLFLSVSGLPPLPGSAWMLNTWHKEEVHINTMHLFRRSCTPEGYRGLLFPQTDPNANLWPVLIKIQEQEVNKKFFSCCTWKVAFGTPNWAELPTFWPCSCIGSTWYPVKGLLETVAQKSACALRSEDSCEPIRILSHRRQWR